MTGASEPARLVQSEVTSRFFDVLGVRAEVGRTFLDGEDQPGRDRVAVLGHALWQQRFGGDPSIIGRSVVVDGISRTVVGVMPPGFHFPSPAIDFWVPVSLDASPANVGTLLGHEPPERHRPARGPASTVRQAEQEAAALVDRSRASFPWRMPDEWGKGVTVVPLERKVVGDVGPMLLVLFGSVARRAADRVRQRREPAAEPRRGARARDRDSRVARRRPRPHRQAAAHGERHARR